MPLLSSQSKLTSLSSTLFKSIYFSDSLLFIKVSGASTRLRLLTRFSIAAAVTTKVTAIILSLLYYYILFIIGRISKRLITYSLFVIATFLFIHIYAFRVYKLA